MNQQHRSPRAADAARAEEEPETEVAAMDNSEAQERLRARSGGDFHLLGQSFGSLQDVHDWLMDERERPGSTVPHEPELRVTVTPGATVRQREQTDWSYYAPDQRLVIDGQGATVSGRRKGRPTPGWFLSYRPVVQSSQAAPAKANFTLRRLTIRGYESGGVELSPRAGEGAEHQYDGGYAAFLEGALIEDNRFEDLGSKDTRYRDTDYAAGRFGAAGVLMRGVSGSTVRGNVFDGLENGRVKGTPTGERLIHAVYARDRSSGNRVEGNTFKDISGDAVRVSNASNDNTITGNRARNAGLRTLVSEFYNSAPHRGEQDSTGNRVYANDRGRAYGQDTRISRFHEKHVRSGGPT